MKQFVVAYGSLLNAKIRAKYISPTDAMYIIHITKMVRCWEQNGVRLNVMRTKNENDYINGALFEIDSIQLQKMDANETSYGFKRSALKHEDILILNYNFKLNANDTVWMYELDHNKTPLFTYLPLHTPYEYVRCCLEGYRCHGIDFMLEFIQTTSNWRQYYFTGLFGKQYSGCSTIRFDQFSNYLMQIHDVVPCITYIPLKLPKIYDRVVLTNLSKKESRNIVTIYAAIHSILVVVDIIVFCYFTAVFAHVDNEEDIDWSVAYKYIYIGTPSIMFFCMFWGSVLSVGLLDILQNPTQIFSSKQRSVQGIPIGVVFAILVIKVFYPFTSCVELLAVLDSVAFMISVENIFGRIACFICGCCYGSPMKQRRFYSLCYSNPLSMVLRKHKHLANKPLFPVQLLGVCMHLMEFIVLYFMSFYVFPAQRGIAIAVGCYMEMMIRGIYDYYRHEKYEKIQGISITFVPKIVMIVLLLFLVIRIYLNGYKMNEKETHSVQFSLMLFTECVIDVMWNNYVLIGIMSICTAYLWGYYPDEKDFYVHNESK